MTGWSPGTTGRKKRPYGKVSTSTSPRYCAPRTTLNSSNDRPPYPMPPLHARSGALKPLTAPPFLRHPTRSTLASVTIQSQSSQSRALSSAHPADPTEAEHPSPHSGHYDPPSGWLFNVPPGEKYKKEGWENLFVYGFWGSCLVGVVGYAYKPDTS